MLKKMMKGLNKIPHRNILMYLLSIIAIFVVFYFVAKWASYSPENFDSGKQVHFFFADWCGHCKRAKPEWEKLKQNNNTGAVLKEHDCSNGVPSDLKSFNVKGFPTIIMEYQGNNIVYSGPRTASALNDWIMQQ